MKIFVLSAILFTVLSRTTALFDYTPYIREATSIWDEEESGREEVDSCECGKWDGSGLPPWNVFVHLAPTNVTERLCTGTIITSNLIATSHKCLLLYPGIPMNAYDLWMTKASIRNVAVPSEVYISVGSETEVIPVEDIIYDGRYAITSAVKSFPDRDIALLKTSRDFLTYPGTLPICIPKYGFAENLTHQLAEYYSVDVGGTLDEDNFHPGLIRPLCVCNEANYLDETEAPNDTELGLGCLQYSGKFGGEVGGGPVVITSASETTFLLGTAAAFAVDVNEENGFEYEHVYFTNILIMIRYIEHHAARSKSKWCTTPELKLSSPATIEGDNIDPYPWEFLKMPVKRKETLNCVCGVLSPPDIGRIVGGQTAVPYEFGWQALLRPFVAGHGTGLCGGSIINDRIILTAAHCVVDLDRYNNTMVASVHAYLNAHEREYDPNAVFVRVDKVFYHPEYIIAQQRGMYFDYDVGKRADKTLTSVLLLKDPIPLVKGREAGLRPVCIPATRNSYTDLVGMIATVIGWGITDPDHRGSVAKKLQKLEIPIADLTLCSNVARSNVTERNICAGTLNKYMDAAQGDSGGPLMIRNSHNQFVEIGIVSWSEDIETPGGVKTAALYSDVQRLLQFIDYYSKRAKANWCKSI